MTRETELREPPCCPHCSAPPVHVRTGMFRAYTWGCGNWMNGAGEVRALRCVFRTLRPWNKRGKAVVL